MVYIVREKRSKAMQSNIKGLDVYLVEFGLQIQKKK